MNGQVMHVGIEEPVEQRKRVLRIAVDSIQALKDFEVHKKINKEKAVYRKHFIQIVKELSSEIQEFKDSMPHPHLGVPEKKKEEPFKISPKKESKIVKKPVIRRKKTHLDELEDDIADLKSKIASL